MLTGGRERGTAVACGLHSYLCIFFVYFSFFSCLFPTFCLTFCALGGFFSCFLYMSCFFFISALSCLFFFFRLCSFLSPFYFLLSFFDLSEFYFYPTFLLVYLQAVCFLQNSRFLGQNTTVISKQISYVSAAVSSHHQADRSEEYRKE